MSCSTVNGVEDPGPVIVGASGVQYNTYADFVLNEPSQSAADVTTAAAAGTITGTALPAWLAVGDYVVLTDATPGNGLVYRYGKILSIVGLVITFDTPWDLGVGEAVGYFRWQVGTVKRPWEEDVTFTKPVFLNGGGNQLKGKVVVSGGSITKVTDLAITNGVTCTAAGVFIWERCDIDACASGAFANYAYCMTGGSNLGATEMSGCNLHGFGSGRCGIARWDITETTNPGIAQTNRNVAWRLWESVVGGAALVVSQAAAFISSVFSGAIFYSENTITGTPAISIKVNAVLPKLAGLYTGTNLNQQPVSLFVFWGVGAGVLTMTPSANSSLQLNITGGMRHLALTSSDIPSGISGYTDYTGTSTLALANLTMRIGFDPSSLIIATSIAVMGTVTCTGVITRTAGFINAAGSAVGSIYTDVALYVALNATITNSGGWFVAGAANWISIGFFASQAVAGAVVACSGNISMTYAASYNAFLLLGGALVSNGTYTLSGQLSMLVDTGVAVASLGSGVSGGTFTVSGAAVRISFVGRSNGTITIGAHAGTGGTLTVSANGDLSGTMMGVIVLGQSSGAGGTAVVSGSWSIADISFVSGPIVLITATTATSTVQVTGVFTFINVRFSGAVTVFNATAVGGVAQAPTSFICYNCTMESTFIDRDAAGLGTYTLAAATWEFNNCTFTGLFTALGTSFTTLQWFGCTFKASPTSLTVTGTRPATFRAFKCQGLGNMLATDLLEMIDEYFTLKTTTGVAQGDLISLGINAQQWETSTANTDIIEGVALTTVAATLQCIGVVRGRIFVRVDVTVLAKDYCVQDAAVPAQAVLGAPTPGKGTIRAFENAGATKAGLAYSSVGVF